MREILPFTLNIAESEISDLKARLSMARWPEAETVDDWSQGVPVKYHREFCEYWANGYDWYQTQGRLNRFDQYRTDIEGLDFHFVHVKSRCSNAKPLLLTHGWPGSIVEFHKVIEPLVDPERHGGTADQACDVICPSLPGFGFSGKPVKSGWGVRRVAAAWDQLMARLGYDHYYAQGGDWGAGVTIVIGAQDLGRCKSIHVNMPTAGPTREAIENPSVEESRVLGRIEKFQRWGAGYHKQQSTRPQTIGYGLSDSPIGQSAWILEKFYEWTDCDGHPENILSRDELIDNIMFYWLTNSGASSARMYWENFNPALQSVKQAPVSLPVGVSVFPEEIMAGPRTWSERQFTNIRYWNELDRGGHFAAFEQPGLFVQEIRNWLGVVG